LVVAELSLQSPETVLEYKEESIKVLFEVATQFLLVSSLNLAQSSANRTGWVIVTASGVSRAMTIGVSSVDAGISRSMGSLRLSCGMSIGGNCERILLSRLEEVDSEAEEPVEENEEEGEAAGLVKEGSWNPKIEGREESSPFEEDLSGGEFWICGGSVGVAFGCSFGTKIQEDSMSSLSFLTGASQTISRNIGGLEPFAKATASRKSASVLISRMSVSVSWYFTVKFGSFGYIWCKTPVSELNDVSSFRQNRRTSSLVGSLLFTTSVMFYILYVCVWCPLSQG